jgi:hypothetical protein
VDSGLDTIPIGMIKTMLRIDPAHPPVWRSPTVLQFGAGPVAVIDDPHPWQQRVVRELERGIPDDAFVPLAEAFGAPSAAVAAQLLARIRPALEAPPRPRRRVTVHASPGVPAAQCDSVASGLAAAGADIDEVQPFDQLGAGDPGSAVVIVAHRLVAPALAASLMADDIAHIPVILTGSGATIGPFVAPGATACLWCVSAHHCDADPTWPVVAAQLLGRSVEADAAVTWEAGLVAGRLISEREGRPAHPRNRSVTLRAGSLHRSVQAHRPHAECRCRSLGGSGRAVAPVRLETRSARAFARPA